MSKQELGRPLSERPFALICKGGKTKQADKNACDINKIMAKYQKGLPITHIAKAMPRYEDVAGIGDYHSAANMVAQAKQLFMELPSHIRDLPEVANDEGKFIAWMENPENLPLMLELGLAEEREPTQEAQIAKAVKDAIAVPTTEATEEKPSNSDGHQ